MQACWKLAQTLTDRLAEWPQLSQSLDFKIKRLVGYENSFYPQRNQVLD